MRSLTTTSKRSGFRHDRCRCCRQRGSSSLRPSYIQRRLHSALRRVPLSKYYRLQKLDKNRAPRFYRLWSNPHFVRRQACMSVPSRHGVDRHEKQSPQQNAAAMEPTGPRSPHGNKKTHTQTKRGAQPPMLGGAVVDTAPHKCVCREVQGSPCYMTSDIARTRESDCRG